MVRKEILVVVKFRPGKRTQEGVIRAIGNLILDIRQQRGCLHFDLYRSENNRDWFVHQIWEDQQAYEYYQHSPQASRLRVALKEQTTVSLEQWRLEVVSL